LLDELDRGSFSKDSGTRERAAVESAESQCVHGVPAGQVRDRAGVADEDARVRRHARCEPTADLDLLIVYVRRGIREEPCLCA